MHLYFTHPASHNNMRVRAKKIKRKEKGYVQHNSESEGLQLYIVYVGSSSKIQTLSHDSSSIEIEVYNKWKDSQVFKVVFLHL